MRGRGVPTPLKLIFMNGGVNKDVLKKLSARYNKQIEEAKEAYKKEKGYQIAHNFRSSPEYKRIKRNRSQAFYRASRKEREKVAESAFSTNQDTYKPVKLTPTSKGGPGLFFTKIAYGSDSNSEALAAFDAAESSGKRVVVLVQDYLGSQKAVYSKSEYLIELQRVYSQAIEIQETEADKGRTIYPRADIMVGTDGDTTYITIEGIL